MRIVACLAVALVAASPALGAPKTVTLDVPGMYCAVCPITVRKAFLKVDGVAKAEVNYDKRRAIVSFDDARTSPNALTRATADAGFPSTVSGAVR